jgi:hypothetical protein
MLAQEPAHPKTKTADKRTFTNRKIIYLDPIMDNSCIKGFWGYSKNGRAGVDDDGIWRLGIVWGNELKPEVPPEPSQDTEKKKAKNGQKK